MKRKNLLIVVCIGLIILLNFLLYYKVLSFGFVFDDFCLIDKGIRFQAFFQTHIENIKLYRPLANITHSITYDLFKLNAFVFHALNLLIHIMNALLVFLISRKILKSNIPSLISAVAFSTFTYNFHHVAYIAELNDTLSAFLLLLSTMLFIKYLDKNNFIFYICSLFTFILALLTRETVIFFPFLLILLYFFLRKRTETIFELIKRTYKYLTPFFLISLVYIILRLIFFHGLGGYNLSVGGSILFKLKYWFAHIFSNYVMTFVPILGHKQLSIAQLIIYLLLTLIVLFWILKKTYDNKEYFHQMLFGFTYILIAILPLFQNTCVRYFYLPSVGFAILLGIPFHKKLRKIWIILLIIFLITMNFIGNYISQDFYSPDDCKILHDTKEIINLCVIQQENMDEWRKTISVKGCTTFANSTILRDLRGFMQNLVYQEHVIP